MSRRSGWAAEMVGDGRWPAETAATGDGRESKIKFPVLGILGDRVTWHCVEPERVTSAGLWILRGSEFEISISGFYRFG